MVHRIKNGFFITLEGGEGAGKTTQLHHLADALRADGWAVYQTREPGGTPGAEALRNLLLFGEETLSWKAEVMTHMAARCDHLDQKIIPALQDGAVVICDRFHDSTWAYQGYGIGEGEKDKLSFITSVRQLISHEPDLTFWLDLPIEVAQSRVNQRGGKIDHYEGKELQFHQRVREGFLNLCEKQNDGRICRINASAPIESVKDDLYERVNIVLRERNVW